MTHQNDIHFIQNNDSKQNDIHNIQNNDSVQNDINQNDSHQYGTYQNDTPNTMQAVSLVEIYLNQTCFSLI